MKLGIEHIDESVEKQLMQTMIMQAEERSMSSSLNKLKTKKLQIFSLYYLLGVSASAVLIGGASKKIDKMEFLTLLIFYGIVATVSNVMLKILNDEVKEIKKYDIYLSIREYLESIDKENIAIPNLFKGVRSEETELNINTLDGYSLRDLKKIRKNYLKYENGTAYQKK